MATSTRFIVRGSPLPEDFQGSLNQLWQAFLDRLEVISPFGEVSLRIGGIKPTSNVGLWVKDGQRIYVWSEDDKDYIPLDLTDSMPQIITVVTGMLAAYYTKTEADVALANALSAALTPITDKLNNPVNFSVTTATPIVTPDLDGASYAIVLPFTANIVESVDGSVDGGNFNAPQAGWYSINFSIHHDSASGSPTSLASIPTILVNGGGVKSGSLGIDDAYGSTITELHWEGPLNVGDTVGGKMEFNSTGSHTRTILVNNTILCGHIVR